MKAFVPACLALAMTASAHAQDVTPKVTLDCSRGFAALVTDIRAKSGAEPHETINETWIYVGSEHAKYAITKQNHVAHPSIVLTQFDVGQHGTITHSGCGFGDQAVYLQFLDRVKQRDVDQVTDGPAPGGQ